MTKILFMGTPDFAVPVLEQLLTDGYDVIGVVTQPDRPKGRKRQLTPPPVKECALEHGLQIFQPEKIKEPAAYMSILATEPDLIVTAAFGQILPKAILDVPKYGCINVHASLLPEFRGGAPIHYAIMTGKKQTGVTIMYMVEALDAGDMIAKISLPIEEEDHVGSLFEKLSLAGANLLSDTLPKFLRGEIKAISQNDAEATYARNISREQEKIDWKKTGEEIYNHVRGLHPWPVAFTTLEGTNMKVWWAKKIPSQAVRTPGQIQAITKTGFVVSTGNETWIELTDIQISGKKRMLAKDYILGIDKASYVGKIFEGFHDTDK